MSRGAASTLSVGIVAKDAAPTIECTLTSIFAGSMLPGEVLVIDGRSRDATVAVARRFPVRIVSNPHRKIAHGRNIGLRHAHGDIIAYTDADCIVAADWIERICRHFHNEDDLVGVGGKMVALPPRNEVEAFASDVFLRKIMQYGNQPRRFETPTLRGAIITANCAYRRSALLDIDGFDEWFGNTGEDIDLFWRLLRSGAKLQYDPGMVIHHRFSTSVRSLCRKHFGFGIASSKLARRRRRGISIDATLYRALAYALAGCIQQPRIRETHAMSALQLISHMLGKYYGSLLARRVNL